MPADQRINPITAHRADHREKAITNPASPQPIITNVGPVPVSSTKAVATVAPSQMASRYGPVERRMPRSLPRTNSPGLSGVANSPSQASRSRSPLIPPQQRQPPTQGV